MYCVRIQTHTLIHAHVSPRDSRHTQTLGLKPSAQISALQRPTNKQPQQSPSFDVNEKCSHSWIQGIKLEGICLNCFIKGFLCVCVRYQWMWSGGGTPELIGWTHSLTGFEWRLLKWHQSYAQTTAESNRGGNRFLSVDNKIIGSVIQCVGQNMIKVLLAETFREQAI